MNRNTELRFGQIPKIHQKRSKFNMSNSIKTTMNVGDVIPLQVWEILPGDTVEMDMAEVIRMATPIYPVMDNMVYDIYFYYVPSRLTWTHFEEFWGQNDNPWAQAIEYEIPQIEAPSTGWAEGSIADYMGIPTGVTGFTVNALPFRGLAKICSDWFRDENLKYACHMYTDETTRTGTNGTDYVTDIELGGMPYKAARLPDLFSKALPAPQKGQEVKIPLGTVAPVTPHHLVTDPVDKTRYPIYYKEIDSTGKVVDWGTGTGQFHTGVSIPDATSWGYEMVKNSAMGAANGWQVTPMNLFADLNEATAASINSLRTAFAIQRFLEAAARFGTRYIEFIRGVFGTESSDARLQRSEYIGGVRFPINMDQIMQTSSTDATTPQGNAAGFSVTHHRDSMFTKSFEEHGYLYCLGVARVEHSYQQGLDKMWSRKKWSSFYNPFFANLGEMPLLNQEIFIQSPAEGETDPNPQNEEVFGYQEAWADYRYRPNRVTGAMRSNAASGSLDAWHYADDYETLPTLGSTWIDEPVENVDRTLAVSSSLSHQLIGDFYFKCSFTRCMPVYSVPGLIDHV